MDGIILLLVIAGIILILFIFGMIGDRRTRRETAADIAALYGNHSIYRLNGREKEHIRSYFENHTADGQIDDITWNDLQMDDIYEQMNYTQSQLGSEYLYYMLRTPATDNDHTADDSAGKLSILIKQEEYYMQHASEREALMLQFHELGRNNGVPVYEYINRIRTAEIPSVIPYIMMDIMLAAGIVFMAFVPSWGILVLLAVIIFNMCFYFSKKHGMDPYLRGFTYTIRMLYAADKLSVQKNIGGFVAEREALREICHKMNGFRRGSFLLMGTGSSNPLEIVLDYIRMILGIDMIKFSQMMKTAKDNLTSIDQMISIIGHMDAVLSLCCYRAYLDKRCCTPEFVTQQDKHIAGVDAEGIYHPLVSKPVRNSIKTEQSVLITGSNASGKSTFLKTVALCALLAQTTGICPAESYRAPYFRIISSMSLSDDVKNGSSYYMTEIRSVRRMIDAVNSDKSSAPVMCFIDEVLRGTNTVERIAASAQILRFFSMNGALCFAATHDIELTSMLEGCYDNYHFREEIKDGLISFPYLIYRGKAESRNAIRLLEAMGYEEEIVRAAERSAEDFISGGEWHI